MPNFIPRKCSLQDQPPKWPNRQPNRYIFSVNIGSTFGCAAGALLGLPAGFAAALGITGLFCGMTNCPITSLLISVELFSADGLLCYAVVCAVSYVCSGYRGLYSSQTILYSKLRAEFINVHTK